MDIFCFISSRWANLCFKCLLFLARHAYGCGQVMLYFADRIWLTAQKLRVGRFFCPKECRGVLKIAPKLHENRKSPANPSTQHKSLPSRPCPRNSSCTLCSKTP